MGEVISLFDDRTQANIKAEMMDQMAQNNQISIMAGSYADATAGAAAFLISELYRAIAAVPAMLFVDETSGPYIDLVGETYFNIARRPGTKAQCSVTLGGTPGTVIPQGTVFLTSTGLEFVSLESVTIPESGTVETTLQAGAVGSGYNIPAAQLTKMYVNIAGLTSYVNQEATGGTDQESDAQMVRRIQERRSKPANGSNGWQYRQWAMDVPGVGDAKVVELADGPGTVGITIVDTQGQPASPEIVEQCQEAMDAQRTVGASVTVDAPEEVEISVTAAVTASIGKERVQEEFEKKLGEYFSQLISAKYGAIYYTPEEDTAYSVPYSRVLVALLTIEGVEDYSAMGINGGVKDIPLEANQIPVLGEVVVT